MNEHFRDPRYEILRWFTMAMQELHAAGGKLIIVRGLLQWASEEEALPGV